MPFLLATPISRWVVPFRVAVNMVGVSPKSPSDTCCEEGTCQELTKERSLVCNSTTATAFVSFEEQPPPLPVAKYNVLLVVSIVTDPQTDAPVQPLGTTLYVFWIVPVPPSSWMILACTSGQSPQDERPI